MINNFKKISNRIFYFQSFFGMARVKFPLPDLGQKIKQGTVKKLYVKEGDNVQQFQKIADVESDKQFTQITAPEIGRIAKIYYNQSQVCKVGDLFMEIQTQGSYSASAASPTSEIQKANKKQQKKQEIKKENQQQDKNLNIHKQDEKFKKGQVNWSQDILASPVVRMFAMTKGVDLYKVKGSGKRGRILKEDIIGYLQGETNKILNNKNLNPIFTRKSKAYQTKTVHMNAFQKGMQKSMTESNKIPHLYYFQTIDVTQAQNMRKKMKQYKYKVTLMGILTKTLSLALKQVPRLNSTYQPTKNQFQFITHASHNVSIAIDSPNGLVAPNIKNVQSLSIMQIQQKLNELKQLSEKAQLKKSHLLDGTICLSNIGTIAGVSACPLILHPQTCIVAIGKVIQKPYFVGSNVQKKKQIVLGFGCDHRVLDGATVARFSNEWKKLLQNPYIALANTH